MQVVLPTIRPIILIKKKILTKKNLDENIEILGNGLTSRSLSESDLSEMDGASFKRAADNLKAAGDNERAAKEAAAAENSGKQSRNSGE